MRNNTCVICGSEFEPREGKLYCSNACKQKGYSDKKQQIGEHEEKEQEIRATRKQFQFYYLEFEEYRSKFPKGVSTFILYCFFRKNLTGVTAIQQVNNYIESFNGDWWDDFWGRDSWGENTGKVSQPGKNTLNLKLYISGMR